ncbi:hypothetical protein PC116_g31453 [Phytophthora cactorum]|nr:hypothetical protein PC116_g31453 [Phytophthora cactorum]
METSALMGMNVARLIANTCLCKECASKNEREGCQKGPSKWQDGSEGGSLPYDYDPANDPAFDYEGEL